MGSNPAFSVVVVAYNHGAYIAQAIQSVLDQTFQDFEIIVLDDGSTDNTKEVVGNFSDHRVKYFFQENSGLPASGRNRGISLAGGEYISLLDADDFWHKEKLAKCKDVLDNMAGVDLVCHNEGIIYKNKILRYTSYGLCSNKMYLDLLLKGNSLHTSAVTIRRSIFFEDGYRFREEKCLFTVEDYEYWLRLSLKYRFHFLSEVLGYYRVTEGGAFLRNAGVSTLNMLGLLDEHFRKIRHKTAQIKMAMARRRSSVMCACARMYQHKDDFRESRKWYSMAINEYPFNYKAALGYLAALLRFRIIYR
ncbi:MAG: glycosyltransferase [Candidatus Omnitrophota bacterium]